MQGFKGANAMKQMWKHIGKTVVFAFVLIFIVALLKPIFIPKTTTGGVPEALQGDLDYIVLGDSQAWSSVSPMQLWRDNGFSGYNCGTPGQRLQDDLYNLQDILTTRHPKVILMEGNMLFGSHGVVGEMEKIMQSTTGRVLPAYCYHDRWKKLLTGEKASTALDINRGFHFATVVQPYTGGDYTQATDDVASIPQVQQLFLNRIVSLCEEQGIQLILYSVPSPSCWTYARHNGLSDYAQKHDITYIDFNLMLSDLGIDWNIDALDGGDHLNVSGASKLTAWMGNYLSQQNLLTDHRNEEGYESWAEDLKAYEQQS